MSNEPPRSRPSSFWKTAPGVITALAALITALTGVFALVMRRDSSAPQPAAVEQRVEPVATGAPPPPMPRTPHIATLPCLRDLFSGISDDRVRPVSAGQENVVVLAEDQTKREPFGVELRDGGAVVGGLLLSFDTDADRYTLHGALDGSCRRVADARNISLGGAEARTFNSWNDLRLPLGERVYVLSFGFTEYRVEVNGFQAVVD